jgi:hypothetical protein
MAYRWSEDGPAFEFPTPFAVENRLLVWRGGCLMTVAVLMLVLTAWLQGSEPSVVAVAIEDRPEPAAAWPFYVLAFVLMAMGVLDLVRASRQRLLRLQRGQPASLAQEVPHEASGVGAGAPALMLGLLKGERPPGLLTGPYQGLLRRLGPVSAAPRPLQVYLAGRVAHLMLGLGLLAVLLIGTAALLNRSPAALSLLAGVISVLGAAFVARQAILTAEPPFGRWVMVAVLALSLLTVAPLFVLGSQLAALEPLKVFQLPLALGVALVSGLLFEWMGLMAGRAQLPTEQPYPLERLEAQVDFGADPRPLVQEVERELYRRWTEGVPNRRYAWQQPFIDRAASEGACSAKMLEESQPVVHATSVATRRAESRPEPLDPDRPPPPLSAPGLHPPPGSRWLKWLAVCGLVWALVGALMWLGLAYTRMRHGTPVWWPAATGLAFLGGAGYALRIGHLLWSRIELQSTLTWIELKGDYVRSTAAAVMPAPDKLGALRGERPVRVDTLGVQSLVVELRSVFYAAVPGRALGFRALLDWRVDTKAGEGWIELVRAFPRGVEAAAAAAAASRPVNRRPAPADNGASLAPGRRTARFCSACGTPVLAAARFCQHCGNALAGE